MPGPAMASFAGRQKPSTPKPCADWVLSTVSNVHAAKDNTSFNKYVDIRTLKTFVYNEELKQLPVMGFGNVELNVQRAKTEDCPTGNTIMELRNVLHVPDAPCNIVSQYFLIGVQEWQPMMKEPSPQVASGPTLAFVDDAGVERLYFDHQAPLGKDFLRLFGANSRILPGTGLAPTVGNLITLFWTSSERQRFQQLLKELKGASEKEKQNTASAAASETTPANLPAPPPAPKPTKPPAAAKPPVSKSPAIIQPPATQPPATASGYTAHQKLLPRPVKTAAETTSLVSQKKIVFDNHETMPEAVKQAVEDITTSAVKSVAAACGHTLDSSELTSLSDAVKEALKEMEDITMPTTSFAACRQRAVILGPALLPKGPTLPPKVAPYQFVGASSGKMIPEDKGKTAQQDHPTIPALTLAKPPSQAVKETSNKTISAGTRRTAHGTVIPGLNLPPKVSTPTVPNIKINPTNALRTVQRETAAIADLANPSTASDTGAGESCRKTAPENKKNVARGQKSPRSRPEPSLSSLSMDVDAFLKIPLPTSAVENHPTQPTPNKKVRDNILKNYKKVIHESHVSAFFDTEAATGRDPFASANHLLTYRFSTGIVNDSSPPTVDELKNPENLGRREREICEQVTSFLDKYNPDWRDYDDPFEAMKELFNPEGPRKDVLMAEEARAREKECERIAKLRKEEERLYMEELCRRGDEQKKQDKIIRALADELTFGPPVDPVGWNKVIPFPPRDTGIAARAAQKGPNAPTRREQVAQQRAEWIDYKMRMEFERAVEDGLNRGDVDEEGEGEEVAQSVLGEAPLRVLTDEKIEELALGVDSEDEGGDGEKPSGVAAPEEQKAEWVKMSEKMSGGVGKATSAKRRG